MIQQKYPLDANGVVIIETEEERKKREEKERNDQRRRRWRWLAAGGVALTLAGGGTAAYMMSGPSQAPDYGNNKDNGTTTPRQEMGKPNLGLSIAGVMAVAGPSGGTVCEDIESFKKIFEENCEALQNGDSSVVIPDIALLFDFKSAELRPQGAALLQEYAKAFLSTNQQATILVSGYACNLGSDEANFSTSERRAQAVTSALVAGGLSADNIEVKWYGKSKNSLFSYPRIEDYRRVLVSIK